MALYVVCNYTQASPHPCSVSIKDPWAAASALFPRQERSRRHGSGVTPSHAHPGGQDTPGPGTGSPPLPVSCLTALGRGNSRGNGALPLDTSWKRCFTATGWHLMEALMLPGWIWSWPFLKLNLLREYNFPKGNVCFLLRLGRNGNKIRPSVTYFRLLWSFFKAVDACVHVAAPRTGLLPLRGAGTWNNTGCNKNIICNWRLWE